MPSSSGWLVMVGLSETKGEEGGNYDHNRQFSRKKKEEDQKDFLQNPCTVQP